MKSEKIAVMFQNSLYKNFQINLCEKKPSGYVPVKTYRGSFEEIYKIFNSLKNCKKYKR